MADTMGEGIMKATTILAFMVWAPMTMAYTDFTASSQSMALVITVYTVIMGNTGITATMAIMAIMAIMANMTYMTNMSYMYSRSTNSVQATARQENICSIFSPQSTEGSHQLSCNTRKGCLELFG